MAQHFVVSFRNRSRKCAPNCKSLTQTTSHSPSRASSRHNVTSGDEARAEIEKNGSGEGMRRLKEACGWMASVAVDEQGLRLDAQRSAGGGGGCVGGGGFSPRMN